jgi:repressor LexA
MEFLTKFQASNGYSPSIRQIGDSINVKSTSLVDYYLNQLQEMGFIEREDHISRSIRVLQPDQPGFSSLQGKVGEVIKNAGNALSDLVTIPIAGRIVASAPIPMPVSDLNYYDAESSVDIARSLLPARDITALFALEVSGDSMIDAMVNDGDIVVMKKANSANNGEMDAVWLMTKMRPHLNIFTRKQTVSAFSPPIQTWVPFLCKIQKACASWGKVSWSFAASNRGSLSERPRLYKHPTWRLLLLFRLSVCYKCPFKPFRFNFIG